MLPEAISDSPRTQYCDGGDAEVEVGRRLEQVLWGKLLQELH
jgi:hypothetical protein